MPPVPSKKRSSKVYAIVGGTIGGVVVVGAIFVGTVTFVQRRWRRKRSSKPRPRSLLSLSNDSMDSRPQMITAPFDPNSSEETQDSGFSAEQQSLAIGDPEAERAALHRRSFYLPAVSPLLPPEGSVPVGFSDKELARLRAEMDALHRRSSWLHTVSPLLPPEGSVPVGLSDKELARLRAEAPSSPLPDNVRVSRSNPSLSTSSPTVVTESGGLTTLLHHTRRLHLDVESLRYEMEHRLLELNRIHAEGFESGAQSIDTSRDE